MKVLYLSSEATPLVKVGGLADVAGELPRSLQTLGLEVRLALPFYPSIHVKNLQLEKLGEIELTRGQGQERGEIYLANVESVPILLIDGDPIRQSQGVYDEPDRDAHKFVFFSLAAIAACEIIGWRPAIVHANDWHTSAAILKLREIRRNEVFWSQVATIFTVHNLPYMGRGSETALETYGIAPSVNDLLPDWARTLPLPMGLEAADWLTTVSPTYAAEIQTPAFGHGLEALLQSRKDRLVGILNGIDPLVWNPAEDEALEAPFTLNTVVLRKKNKTALQEGSGLPIEAELPVLGMITRLDHQKGVDLVLEALTEVLDEGWQFILLGSGDAEIEKITRTFANKHLDRVRVVHRFDPQLARRIYGGSDMILIPSRYEPCGLAQMIAMRYGSVPLVRATGGLKDTVVGYDHGEEGTGFLFEQQDPGTIAIALRTAFDVYKNKDDWVALQQRGMLSDFSWHRSAERYTDLYHEATREKLRAG